MEPDCDHYDLATVSIILTGSLTRTDSRWTLFRSFNSCH